MSLTKSATRRLSLLAGSSLVAASLSATVSVGVMLAPTAAVAQATCVTPPAPTSGNGSNAVTYAADTYNPGITCTFVGDNAKVSTSGAITVSASGGVPADPLINGINLLATGTSDISWDSTAGRITGGAQTNGPVIDASSQAGNITIKVGSPVATANSAIQGTSATVTHGVRAISTGGGSIDISTFRGIAATNSTSGFAAIEARTSGGDGDIIISAPQPDSATGSIGGRLYGILAENAGTGDLTITGVTIPISGATAAIDATTNTGTLTLTLQSIGIVRTTTAGTANVNLGNVTRAEMNSLAGGQTTLTHSGGLGISGGDTGSIAARGQGAGNITINSNGLVQGYADFSNHAGSLTWNVNDGWATQGTSNVFGAGNHTIVIAQGADWLTGLLNLSDNSVGAAATLETTVINFGGGNDRVLNAGTMVLGPKSAKTFSRYQTQDTMESLVRLENLETFENAGSIYFGSSALPGQAEPGPPGSPGALTSGSYASAPDFTETDYTNDDVLLMPGTHWLGSGDSRLVMDVQLSANQSACDVSLRNTAVTVTYSTLDGVEQASIPTLTGDMPAADCLGLQGGSTEGETKVLINQLGGGDRGGPIRIVLVDVAGGESGTGHFVLDPMNHGYVAEQGGYLDVGYFIFPLVYDAEAQQHVLLGTAGPNAWQTATWATAAHDLWRTSTGSWFDRQADLRNALSEGVGGGIWLRTSSDLVDRGVTQLQPSGTSIFTFNNSYEQNTYAVTGGLDLMLGGGADSAWVVGLMAGYANAELTYAASPNTARLDSWNGGLYASFLSGGLYVDAALSANKADVEADMPGLGLLPAGTMLSTPFLSVGAQIEGGYRFALSDGVFLEPLAGVSWVRTEWDQLRVASDDPLRPGVDVDFGDPVSLRGNVGARLGLDQDYGAFRAQYSVLGRVWNEAEGQHELTLANVQEDVFVGDELTGSLSELGLGASIYGSVVSGFLNVGGKWADDYESVGGSVGVRVAW